jgi:exosortase/archaeosortase family protein
MTRAERSLRIFGALLLAAAGVAVIWLQGTVRDDEASIAGRWFGAVLHGKVSSAHDVVVFPWSKGPLVGLKITSECTVALLLGPLIILAGLMLAVTTIRVQRLLAGLTAGLAVVVLVNQLRLALIAVSTQHWGISGYDVSHKFVGTLIALAGFVTAVLLMIRLAAKPVARGSHASR